MDREREAGIIGASGAGLLVVGLIAYIAWRKRNKENTGWGLPPADVVNEASILPYLNNQYELSDDGYYLTSYTNGTTKGWKNHNPLNILNTQHNQWRGEITQMDPDSKYEIFISNIYGYRAAIKNIRTYIRNGYNTLEKIVDRWSGVNNNTAYRDFVYTNSAVDRNTPIAEDDWTSIMSLVNAMAMMENGKSPEPDENEIVDAALMVYYGV